MLERLASTGSGFPTVYRGDQVLHSRYNPSAEAERYINSLSFRENSRFFILMEPGLGYLIQPLRRRFPQAFIIALHVSDFFTRGDIIRQTAPPDGEWSPGAGKSLQEFLEEQMPDTEASAVVIVEWRPALTVFGQDYLRLFSDTVEFIKRSDANKRTTRNFGQRWFKNVFKNARLLKKILRYPVSSQALVITGAGPGLEEVIPLMAEQKQRFPLFILAVSSSVPALLAAGLVPDLILTTDGGNWALLHLYEALRGRGRTGTAAFAAAMTAALPSQFGETPWLPLSDGSLWQNLILKSLNIPFIILPQRGTVTATALDLAFLLTGGSVYITGTDLAHRDIRTHARPYSFDRLPEAEASRFRPVYSQTFTRASLIAASGSHRIYADWFTRQMAAYPNRLFSLGNNSAAFDPRKVPGAFGTAQFRTRALLPEIRESPGEITAEALSAPLLRALETDESRTILLAELGPLLFPEEPQPPPELVGKEIVSLIRRYWGEQHG
jgi:hypothetical protein